MTTEAEVPGFTKVTEWRVVSATGEARQERGLTDTEADAREWAAHCNGAGHTDRDQNTYMINERPFHVECRTILVGPWATPRPLTEFNQVDSVHGSALDSMRLDANAADVDNIYPGYRENLPHTLAVLRARGPWCDTCFGSTIWSEGLGWCHLVDGRNVLPHQDTAGHPATSSAWAAL